TPQGGTADTLALMRKKSILDYVDGKYNTLKAKLGTSDRARLDQHLTQLRDLESRISITTMPPPSMCVYPAKVDTTGYNPPTGLMADDNGQVVDSQTDMKIPL